MTIFHSNHIHKKSQHHSSQLNKSIGPTSTQHTTIHPNTATQNTSTIPKRCIVRIRCNMINTCNLQNGIHHCIHSGRVLTVSYWQQFYYSSNITLSWFVQFQNQNIPVPCIHLRTEIQPSDWHSKMYEFPITLEKFLLFHQANMQIQPHKQPVRTKVPFSLTPLFLTIETGKTQKYDMATQQGL